MAPPTQLAVAIGSVNRLVKEEASYHKELQKQEARLEKLLASEEEDENAEFSLKQERSAIEETKAVFPPLRQRLDAAVAKLEDQLEAGDSSGGSADEITRAKEVIAQVEAARRKDAVISG